MNKFERNIDPMQAMETGEKIHIINRIKELCVEHLGDDDDFSKSFTTNGLDDLDFIELLIYIEKEFDVIFDETIESLFNHADNSIDYSMDDIFDKMAIFILEFNATFRK